MADIMRELGEIKRRQIRTETKLNRFAEELGIPIEQDEEWLSVDEGGLQVYLSTLGRSHLAMLSEMARRGAKSVGKSYELIHRGEHVGTIIYRPLVFKPKGQ